MVFLLNEVLGPCFSDYVLVIALKNYSWWLSGAKDRSACLHRGFAFAFAKGLGALPVNHHLKPGSQFMA